MGSLNNRPVVIRNKGYYKKLSLELEHDVNYWKNECKNMYMKGCYDAIQSLRVALISAGVSELVIDNAIEEASKED